jgi:hypothetical protein
MALSTRQPPIAMMAPATVGAAIAPAITPQAMENAAAAPEAVVSALKRLRMSAPLSN